MDKDRPTCENLAVLTLRTEILKLRTTTSFLVGFLQNVKARAIKAEMDFKKGKETAAAECSQQNTFTDKVSSLTKELPSIRVECANLRAELIEMKALA